MILAVQFPGGREHASDCDVGSASKFCTVLALQILDDSVMTSDRGTQKKKETKTHFQP